MSTTSSLAGKVAVITGSTQGLGEATAHLFAERGAAGVVVNGRNADRGAVVVGELQAAGTKAVFAGADMADLDACRGIISTAEEAFGRIDILVNCAAITDRGSIWDTTPELFDRMMEVNARAPFFLMQDAIKVMERTGTGGSIINISSVASHASFPFLCPYAASKGAINVLTKSVAYQVMRSHIRVNALLLGQMDTPGEDTIQRKYHGAGDNWLAETEAAMPFGRILKTDEVARAIAYLASEESGMQTGTLIDFDQSVIGAGPQPLAPPKGEWPKVTGVSYE